MNPKSSSHVLRAVLHVGSVYTFGLLVCSLLMAWPTATDAQAPNNGCDFSFGGGGGGPWDYRSDRHKLPLVEPYHFTPQVESLRRGQSTTLPGPDIGYTLGKFPNHHRALLSLSKLGLKAKTDYPEEMRYSITCYFERAIRFRPDDTVARLIYARHLSLTGSSRQAKSQLELAGAYAKDNPLTHYNIGLIALEMKDYETALKHAQIAYGLGITTAHLRDELKKAGKWAESASPEATTQAATPSSAASVPRAPLPQ